MYESVYELLEKNKLSSVNDIIAKFSGSWNQTKIFDFIESIFYLLKKILRLGSCKQGKQLCFFS